MLEFDDSIEKHDPKNREFLTVGKTDKDKKIIRDQFISILKDHLNKMDLERTETFFITDPYLFNAWQDTWYWYKPFLEETLTPIYAKVGTVIVIVEKYEMHLVSYFKQKALAQGCKLRVLVSNLYHDRIWLYDATQKAIYIGTSLTGIGSKYAFINPLPDADAQDAWKSIQIVIQSPHKVEL